MYVCVRCPQFKSLMQIQRSYFDAVTNTCHRPSNSHCSPNHQTFHQLCSLRRLPGGCGLFPQRRAHQCHSNRRDKLACGILQQLVWTLSTLCTHVEKTRSGCIRCGHAYVYIYVCVRVHTVHTKCTVVCHIHVQQCVCVDMVQLA